MIISTSNDVLAVTPTVITGSTTDTLSNIIDPDFSVNITSASAIFNMDFGNVADIDYVALHGIRLSSDATLRIKDGTTTLFTCTGFNSSNAVFWFDTPYTSSTGIRIEIDGGGTKTISYFACGSASVVPNSGVQGGQVLPYFQQNYKTRSSANDRAQPTAQVIERYAPKMQIKIPHPTKTWVRDDLQAIFDLYQQTGILSVRDFEDADEYLSTTTVAGESWAGFDLTKEKVNAHSATRLLVPVILSMKASV